MRDDSFQFGKYNGLDDFGIRMMYYDVLMPQKRRRQMQVPFRDGTYDFGAKNYDDRIVRVRCTWYNPDTLNKSRLREIAYMLSAKKDLSFFDEPDKHYTGQLYDPAEVVQSWQNKVVSFELNFLCEPFASAGSKTIEVSSGDNLLDYQGTAPTRPLLILRNTGDTPINGIFLTKTIRKD